jgi:hypothetical protein
LVKHARISWIGWIGWISPVILSNYLYIALKGHNTHKIYVILDIVILLADLLIYDTVGGYIEPQSRVESSESKIIPTKYALAIIIWSISCIHIRRNVIVVETIIVKIIDHVGINVLVLVVFSMKNYVYRVYLIKNRPLWNWVRNPNMTYIINPTTYRLYLPVPCVVKAYRITINITAVGMSVSTLIYKTLNACHKIIDFISSCKFVFGLLWNNIRLKPYPI